MDGTTTSDVGTKEHPVKVEKTSKNLPTRIPDPELLVRSRRSHELFEEAKKRSDANEKMLDHAKAQAKLEEADIEKLEAEARQLLKQVHDGEEYRPTQCERRFIYRTNTYQEVRLDTGATLLERALTPEEAQLELPQVGSATDESPGVMNGTNSNGAASHAEEATPTVLDQQLAAAEADAPSTLETSSATAFAIARLTERGMVKASELLSEMKLAGYEDGAIQMALAELRRVKRLVERGTGKHLTIELAPPQDDGIVDDDYVPDGDVEPKDEPLATQKLSRDEKDRAKAEAFEALCTAILERIRCSTEPVKAFDLVRYFIRDKAHTKGSVMRAFKTLEERGAIVSAGKDAQVHFRAV